ncbi:Phosphoribosyl 1,2-cyclic phosphodiesterase [Neorhodopirellula lusitana]|uniref:Phosphoribosyl 1,2-cyclic phosphodiesterase n=1 Tax=Neorhodopirellula lusitana TaxID=445327 RepID=A0ABY1QI88_9BACT|nr:MBL fold metallo-hydrolase [Neorhodopirellula lusitana]SMP70381.1 Phosphoribosyl 1,2-cyclic phosphodiesterase [Neorhodopirellula lusitana]
MEVISLQSGSSGNCVFVRIGQTRLLFDAGISGRKTQSRLALHGHDVHDVDALVISHDHSDHIAALGPLHRRFGLPVYLTRPTHRVVSKKPRTGELSDVRHFQAGQTLEFPGVTVHTIPTAHDAVDGVCFVVEDLESGTRFGLMMDLGHCFRGLSDWIGDLDAIMIESNYDLPMLRDGFYPRHLKERIHGKGGHLSNDDASKLVRDHAGQRLQWVCLAHLSDENNTPELAVKTCRAQVPASVQIHCADRYDTTEPMLIRSPKILAKRSSSAKPGVRIQKAASEQFLFS